jgi:hypothetical protein
MESRALVSLRREVRHLVHRTCRQRLDGDETGAQKALDSGLANLLSAEPTANVEEPAVREWVAAEEAEFDRALLISDLVVSRMGRAERQEKTTVKASQVIHPAPAHSRPAATGSPIIADMLDDMLSQQKRPRARSA